MLVGGDSGVKHRVTVRCSLSDVHPAASRPDIEPKYTHSGSQVVVEISRARIVNVWQYWVPKQDPGCYTATSPGKSTRWYGVTASGGSKDALEDWMGL